MLIEKLVVFKSDSNQYDAVIDDDDDGGGGDDDDSFWCWLAQSSNFGAVRIKWYLQIAEEH